MTLTPNLIACLAIGGAGILTALLSIPFFRRTGKLRRRCSARTEGTVIRYHYQPKQSGGPSIAPVAAFQVNGVGYTARLHYKSAATVSKSAIFFRNDTDCRAERHLSRPAGVSSPEHGGNGTGDLAARQQTARSLRPGRPQVCLHRPRGIQGERGRHHAAVRRRRAGGTGNAGRRIVFIIGENDFPRQHCTRLFGVLCTALP